jgi:DNA polymerase/3'-5' exonuclease PolX
MVLALGRKNRFLNDAGHLKGSKEHNVVLRAKAERTGLKANEGGVYKGTGRLGVCVYVDGADVLQGLVRPHAISRYAPR